MNVLDLEKEFDFNFQYTNFFNNSENKLNNFIKTTFTNEVYITLIIMDFTFLNSLDKNLGYEPGTLLKELILKFLRNKEKKYEIIYQTITSSKIFLFSKKKINSNFKNELTKFSELEIKKKYSNRNKIIREKLLNKTLIYIIEKDSINNKYFKIEKYLSSSINENIFKLLFLKAYLEELNLNKLRNKINYFFNNNLEFKNNLLAKEFEKEIINLLDLDIEFNKLTLKKIDLEFNKIKEINIKNSKYLSLAYQNYKNGYDLYQILFLIIKYLIWIKMQELQFLGFKYEKIYLFFNREHENYTNNKNNSEIIKFTNKDNFISWFNSSVEIFSPVMSISDLKIKNKIKVELENLDFNNFNEIKKIRDKIQNFFDHFQNPKGLFNIPLEKIKPNRYMIECLKNELYSNFSSNYKNEFHNWLNLKDDNFKSIIREGMYTSINKAENMIYALEFINKNEIVNFNDIYKIRIHIAFLEIDGFNSLNNVYFPNDSDSILYGRILEILGKINLRYIEKYNKIFKSFITSIAGDEFYFSFITFDDIEKENKEIFFKFLIDFKKEVLNQLSKIKFPKSQKEIVILKNDISVCFRKILFQEKKFFKKNTIEINLTTIGITGCILFNNSVIKNNKFSFERFKQLIITIDSELTINLKANYRGLISIIDYKGRVLYSK